MLEDDRALSSPTNFTNAAFVARRRSSLLNTLAKAKTSSPEMPQGNDEPFTLGRPEESVTDGQAPRRLSNLGVPRRSSFLSADSNLNVIEPPNLVSSGIANQGKRPSLFGSHVKAVQSHSSMTPISFVLCAIGSIAIVLVLLSSAMFSRGDTVSYNELGSLTAYHTLMNKYKIESYTLVPNLVTRHRGVERLLQQVFLSSRGNGANDPVELEVQIGKVNATLDLRASEAIYPRNQRYKEIRVMRSTNRWRIRERDSKTKRCVFEARVRGDPDSFGTVTLCDGKVNVAMMNHRDAKAGFSLTQIDSNMHVLITGNSAVSPDRILKCGDADPPRRTEALFSSDGEESKVQTEGRTLQSVFLPRGERNKTVKVLIVNDAARYDMLESSTEADTVAVMQLIRSIYSQVYSATSYGIDIELIGQITFVDGADGWSTPPESDTGLVDSQSLLNDFYAWKQANDAELPDADLVHLFSGREFLGGIVGRSAQGGVCDDRNVGVNQLVGFDMTVYSRIVAHEIGHGLTLYHDNTYSDPACTSSTDTFMWSSISMGTNPKWTPCAIAAWRAFFDGKPSPYTYLGCLEDSVSSAPSANPTQRAATRTPTIRTGSPVVRRTPFPTSLPTTRTPTLLPTSRAPTASTLSPSAAATLSPTTKSPTDPPTGPPTDPPTRSPTIPPTARPTTLPTAPITLVPSTLAPSPQTTALPTTSFPTTAPTRAPTRIVIIPIEPGTDTPSSSPTTSPGFQVNAASSSQVAVAAGAGGVSVVFVSALAFALVMWRRKKHTSFIATARESLRGPKSVIKPQLFVPQRSRGLNKGDKAETSGRELSVHNDQDVEDDPLPLPKPPKAHRKAPTSSDGPHSVVSRELSTQTDAEQPRVPDDPLPRPKPRAFRNIIRRTDAPPAISRELSTNFDLEMGLDGDDSDDDPTPLPGSSLVFNAAKKDTGKGMRPSDLSVS